MAAAAHAEFIMKHEDEDAIDISERINMTKAHIITVALSAWHGHADCSFSEKSRKTGLFLSYIRLYFLFAIFSRF